MEGCATCLERGQMNGYRVKRKMGDGKMIEDDKRDDHREKGVGGMRNKKGYL